MTMHQIIIKPNQKKKATKKHHLDVYKFFVVKFELTCPLAGPRTSSRRVFLWALRLMWFLRSWAPAPARCRLVDLVDSGIAGDSTRIHALLLDLLTVGHANLCLCSPSLGFSAQLFLRAFAFLLLFCRNLQVLTNRTFWVVLMNSRVLLTLPLLTRFVLLFGLFCFAVFSVFFFLVLVCVFFV